MGVDSATPSRGQRDVTGGIERKCQRCGGDTYFAREFERVVSRMNAVEQRYLQQARDHAVAIASRDLKLLEAEQSRRSLQRKTHTQAAAIRRLESKLLARGDETPYRVADPAPRSGAERGGS